MKYNEDFEEWDFTQNKCSLALPSSEHFTGQKRGRVEILGARLSKELVQHVIEEFVINFIHIAIIPFSF